MVYVLNSQYCYSGPELIRRRNILFTAISRSKCWVRISRIGLAMENLKTETDMVAERDYHLEFTVPSPEQLERLRKTSRDITEEERNRLRQVSEFVELIEKGELPIESVPPELREKLRKTFSKKK